MMGVCRSIGLLEETPLVARSFPGTTELWEAELRSRSGPTTCEEAPDMGPGTDALVLSDAPSSLLTASATSFGRLSVPSAALRRWTSCSASSGGRVWRDLTRVSSVSRRVIMAACRVWPVLPR